LEGRKEGTPADKNGLDGLLRFRIIPTIDFNGYWSIVKW
jgi:hypothetical protein